MTIEKIKIIKYQFMSTSGPVEIISLGIKSGDITIL